MSAATFRRPDAEVADADLTCRSLLRPPALAGGTLVRGHLDELARDNLALFRRCSELDGLVRFRVYFYQCHALSDPELLGELLMTHASAFKKTRALQIARPTFGNGLVTSEGETWRRQRRLLGGFLTPRAASGYTDLMTRITLEKISHWRETGAVDLHEDFVDVSLEVACRALFGIGAGPLKPLVRGAAHAVQQWHSDCQALCLPYPHYYPTPSNFRYRKQTRALDRAVYELIARLRASDPREHGLLGALLEVRNEDGSGVTDREIRDHLVTLFLAGHDTTAASLALALYELGHRPDLQDQIADEVTRDGTSECLENVLKEALRLYPAVHLIARTALRDVALGRYLIRAGEEVVVSLMVMHRSPRLFVQPDDFEPARWTRPETLHGLHRYASVPFGTGPRVCTGQALAMAELRTIIATVLTRFRLEPLEPRPPALDCRLTLAPMPGSTRVRAVPRVSGRHGRASAGRSVAGGSPAARAE